MEHERPDSEARAKDLSLAKKLMPGAASCAFDSRASHAALSSQTDRALGGVKLRFGQVAGGTPADQSLELLKEAWLRL